MDKADNVAAVRSWYDAFNRRDVDAFVEHLDPAIRWFTLDMSLAPRLYRGREAVREYVTGVLSAGTYVVEPEELVSSGDRVLARISLRGRRGRRGAGTAFRVVQVWTVRDGRAIRQRLFLDAAKAARSLRRAGARDLPAAAERADNPASGDKRTREKRRCRQ